MHLCMYVYIYNMCSYLCIYIYIFMCIFVYSCLCTSLCLEERGGGRERERERERISQRVIDSTPKEVNMFKDDGTVLHFTNPKVQAGRWSRLSSLLWGPPGRGLDLIGFC